MSTPFDPAGINPQLGQPITTGRGPRPGAVTAAAVVAFVYAGLMTIGAIAIAVLSPTVLAFVIAVVNVVLAGLFVWSGVLAWRSERGKPLAYTALAALVIGAIALIYAVVQSGGAVQGILGLILPGVIWGNMMNAKTREYFGGR